METNIHAMLPSEQNFSTQKRKPVTQYHFKSNVDFDSTAIYMTDTIVNAFLQAVTDGTVIHYHPFEDSLYYDDESFIFISETRHYRQAVHQLQASLSEDKLVTQDAMNDWILAMEDKGTSERTIRNKLSVIDKFCAYVLYEWPDELKALARQNKTSDSVLQVRQPYYDFLNKCKKFTYSWYNDRFFEDPQLLARVLVTTGILPEKLGLITVENCIHMIKNESCQLSEEYDFPEALSKELLAKATNEGRISGQVFDSEYWDTDCINNDFTIIKDDFTVNTCHQIYCDTKSLIQEELLKQIPIKMSELVATEYACKV